MNLPLFIAWRYLLAKKSHNVINIISAISATGMAIGTAAVILILSIYNGFDDIIERNVSEIDPDFLIVNSPAGTLFQKDSALTAELTGLEGVEQVRAVLQEKLFIRYKDHQRPATARGIEGAYGLGVEEQLAAAEEINPNFTEKLQLWYPDRKARISPLNLNRLLSSISIHPDFTFSSGTTIHSDLVTLPLEKMQELLQCDDRISGIQIFTKDLSARKSKKIKRNLVALSGPGFEVLGRYEQNESMYKMLRYEKLAIFGILLFVILIVVLNISTSLSLLRMEKKEDIAIIRAMGGTDSMIRKIFRYEGLMISMAGMLCGLALGVILSLVQQHFGLIKMPGNYLLDSYPVILQAGDLLAVTVSICIISYLISTINSKKSTI